MSFLANLSAFSAGVSFGWTSPVIPKLKRNIENPLGVAITTLEESWITGLLSLGCIFSPFLGGFFANRFGRKPTLLLATCPILLGFIIKAFASNVPTFYAARFLMGIGAGSIYSVAPMYLGEIAEDHNRGAVSGTMVVFVTSGFLFAFAIGPFTSIQNFSLICCVPVILFLVIFSLWNPESPMFLALSNSTAKLENSLRKLRNKSKKEIELEATQILEAIGKNNQKSTKFNKKSVRKGLVLCLLTIFVQQFSGINSVLSYLQPIFELSAVSLSPEISPIIIGVVQVIMTSVSSCLVDRLGRKLLLVLSAIGASLALSFLGIYYYFSLTSLEWMPILCLVVYIVSFNIGLAPIPWTLMTELFPPDIKSITSTISGTSCFIFCFLTVVLFPILISTIGTAISFWMFAFVGFGGGISMWIYLPETKGKNLQEIIQLLEK